MPKHCESLRKLFLTFFNNFSLTNFLCDILKVLIKSRLNACTKNVEICLNRKNSLGAEHWKSSTIHYNSKKAKRKFLNQF